MQDREFKVGDRVRFADGDLVVRGELIDIMEQQGQVRVANYMNWFVDLNELQVDNEFEEGSTGHKYHTCVPYVGVFRVEPKCVHCDRYITEQEVFDYVKKIGE